MVFSESRVIANYLHRELQEDNPGVNIDVVRGGDNHTADKITKFSPKSNDIPGLREAEQTKILITTDVLAEGQNLQDCNRVFSYDLIGLDNPILETGERVNRKSIYSIYNGEMPAEEDSITDSLAVAQEGNALLNRVRRENPETWQKVILLPKGLRSAMSGKDTPT